MSSSGAKRPPGPSGPPGLDGFDGSEGSDGQAGHDGATGATGPTGPTGPTGAQGPTGPPGIDGIDGHDGIDGRPGVIGALSQDKILIGQAGNVPGEKALTGDVNIQASGATAVIGWDGQQMTALAGAGAGAIPRNFDGTQWTFDVAASAGNSWTPVITQSANVTFTQNNATYIQIGKLVFGWCRLTPTSAGTANNVITVSVPVTAKTNTLACGAGFMTLAGTQYRVNVVLNSTTVFSFRRCDVTGTGQMGVDPNAALANSGDSINFFFMYEAA